MTPVRWGFALEFGKIGGRGPEGLVNHLFEPGSVTPICMPREPGTPVAFEAHNAWSCEACKARAVRVDWSQSTLGGERFWTLHLNGGKAIAEGIARNEHDAVARVIKAAAAHLPASTFVVLGPTSARYAEEVAKERRAEKRAERPGQVGVFQETHYLYRHKLGYAPDGSGYIWRTERARISKTTAKRVFVEREVRKTERGATMLTTFSLERDVLDRMGKCRGWTRDPDPPDDGTRTVRPWWAETLGVAAGCTLDDARKAYRRKAAETHPDRGGTADAFQRVAEAWAEARRWLGDEAFTAQP